MHLDGHLSEVGLHHSGGGSAPASSLMPSALSLSGEYAHPPPVLSLPPNCSLITTTAVTLGGCWVGGCANAPHTPPHHPATTSSPSSPRNFFVPRHSGGCREYTEDSNRLLLTSLVAFPRLLVSPQTPTQFSHLSRYADLPWLVLYVPSSFLAEFQCSHASETDLIEATCLVIKACKHAR